MISYYNIKGTKYNLNRIYNGKDSIAAIYKNGVMLCPRGQQGEMILSCYYNGYWIDEYPWTDETPWQD